MPRRSFNRVGGVGGVGLLAVACLGGCVTSGAARFEDQMTCTIKADRAINPQVAVAFGLDTSEPLRVSVGAVRDEPYPQKRN
jgi:hypothetical protein